jgi:hypothetical protein
MHTIFQSHSLQSFQYTDRRLLERGLENLQKWGEFSA